MEMIFEYGKKEAAYLRKKDEVLGAYMKKRGLSSGRLKRNRFRH